MSGVFFHWKKADYKDCYKASGSVTLPRNSYFIPSKGATDSFVAYAQYGCHGYSENNFDAGIVVQGGGKYALIINGGNAIEKKSGSSWYQTPSFSASGTSLLTVELVYLTASTGKVVVKAFNQTLEANFASGQWAGNFQRGGKFSKEMTVASSAGRFTDLWSDDNVAATRRVYMNDMTFGPVSITRHTGTTVSLDSNSSVTTTPVVDGAGSLPPWSQFRYGMSPIRDQTNYFSIDCRPE